MSKHKVLIFIVCYYAEDSIAEVLRRIPSDVLRNDLYEVDILIIDDASGDQTYTRAKRYQQTIDSRRITVLFNPDNLGYGGNQKLGYHYAILNGYEAVVLLHGDGQYAPEYLDSMIRPLVSGEADVVLGSRMLSKRAAIKGGMPLYKWVGNQVLTFLQNRILGTALAEFHTGYRGYRVTALASVPFEANADYFDFDTDILIQMIDTGKTFKEVAIPTFYGEEISRVNSIRYGLLILRSSLRSRIQKLGIYFDPKFDYEQTNAHYALKLGYASSHQFALTRVRQDSTVANLGCGPGPMDIELSRRGVQVIAVDSRISDETRAVARQAVEADLDTMDLNRISESVDTVLLLDVIEHLKSPEAFLAALRERFCRDRSTVIITTGNIAFLPIRLGLLLGGFNYGKRGILDLTHSRLFTFASLRRTLIQSGYDVLEVRGIPAPFPLALGQNRLSLLLVRLNAMLIRVLRGVLSYQIAIVARPRPTVQLLLDRARQASAARDASSPVTAGGESR